MFVLGIIFLVLAVVGVVLAFTVGTGASEFVRKARYSYEEDQIVKTAGTRKWYFLGSGISLVLAIVFTIFSSTYTVDTGSSVVLKDWSGVVQEDAVTSAGFHTKAPWQNDIAWDIKNQDVTFTGDGSTTHNGQAVAGAQITIRDKDGISADLDIQVLFSIKADKVVDLTKGFTDQTDFELKVVENDVKSIPRDTASTFTTVQMFEERVRFGEEVEKEIKKAWAERGVLVENVNIHGIRYPADVEQRFKDAQNAQTDLLTAQTQKEIDLTKAQGEAAAKIERANGEATANNTLAASLTPAILQKLYIDALAANSKIIVPEDFTALGNIGQ